MKKAFIQAKKVVAQKNVQVDFISDTIFTQVEESTSYFLKLV
ncbi:MAG: hypothetical protein JWQ28_3048 [Pedobacter sp.]|jgi:hypothetical protein|nr:hypothetical protein [Pedobacter sp.]